MKAEERQVTGDLKTKEEWIQTLIPLDLAALAIPEPLGLFKMFFRLDTEHLFRLYLV